MVGSQGSLRSGRGRLQCRTPWVAARCLAACCLIAIAAAPAIAQHLTVIDPGAVKAALARARINVSVTDAAWTRIDMDNRGIPSLVRASVHYYNTEEEVDALAAAVGALSSANSISE